ncbi:unnamed protein product, partial [Pylaiella littoralis]
AQESQPNPALSSANIVETMNHALDQTTTSKMVALTNDKWSGSLSPAKHGGPIGGGQPKITLQLHEV